MLHAPSYASLLAVLLATASATAAGPVQAPEKTTMHTLKRIVLDPGHGGENTGCMGFHGVFEKYLTLQIAERVEANLRRTTDAEVFLTRRRDEDFGLRERAQYASEVGADVFVSIHLNASLGGVAHGIETYFLSMTAATDEIAELVAREEASLGPAAIGESAADAHRRELDAILLDAQLGAAHQLSERLAATTQHELTRSLRPTLSRGVKQAPFAVLKEATVPAVVVECGFLTNLDEGTRLLLEDHQERVAQALVRALVAFDRSLGE